jgi:hypothetical protein
MASFKTVSYTAARFTSLNPILESQEEGIESDTGKFKFGDGVTAWTVLPYGFPVPPSGTGNVAQATVNFGFDLSGEGDTASVTVPAAWVDTNSVIVCTPYAVQTSSHDPQDVLIEGIEAYATNIVPGVSFDVIALAPNNTFGQYVINAQELKL